jgi:hypothetical protein
MVVQPVFSEVCLFFPWTLKLNFRALHSAFMFLSLAGSVSLSVCEEH